MVVQFIYDHEKYTHELERICDERRGQLFESWKQLGGRIGTSEWDIKTHAAAPPAHPASIAASTLPALNGAKTNGIHGGAHSSKQNGAAAAGAEQPGQGQDEFHDAPLASEEDVTKAFSESLTLDGSPKATV